MDKKEAIQFLKIKLSEIPHLMELPHDSQEYPLWNKTVQYVLEEVFGWDSSEYQDFINAPIIYGFVRDSQREYMEKLRRCETAIQSIVKKYEILGIKTKPRAMAEPKDAGELPIQLFDAMKFHPKVVEASRSCFVAGNYREAILNAFIRLIDYIKERTGLDLDGDDLMNKVFSFNYDKDLRKITKYPIIRINELKNSNDRNEQQGFMFLCKGAAGGIRNPKAHKLITQSNPLHTLEYLAFASLLIRRVEEGKVVKPKPPRERWNLEKFLIDAEKRCMPEKVEIMKKLIDFTTSNSDAGILWGTGAKYGSFVFQKPVNNKATSIFQIYTDGTLFLYFQPLKNKGVSIALLNQFRLNVNKIPGVNITENVVNEKDKYGSLSLNIFINPSNLNIFKEAVLSLCKDLENYKETSS